MVTKKSVKPEDEPTGPHEVVPGPAEEAEGTIHPAEAPAEKLPQPDDSQKGDIVDQVLRGEWGTGQDRRLRLQKAGYSPNEVQKQLVDRANKR